MTAADVARRLVDTYRRGAVTEHELVLRLAQLADEHSPESFASSIPPEFIDELRRQAADPPPPGGLIGGSVCAGSDYDWKAQGRDKFDRYRRGLLLWREYFSRVVGG